MKTTNEIAQAAWDEISAVQMTDCLADWDENCIGIITKAIESATAQVEPVWYACDTEGAEFDVTLVDSRDDAENLVACTIADHPHLSFEDLVTPLYTSPPKRQPLTPERIEEIWVEHVLDECDVQGFAQAILAASLESPPKPVQGEAVKSTRPLTAPEAQELKAIGITGEYRRVIAFNDRPAQPKQVQSEPVSTAPDCWYCDFGKYGKITMLQEEASTAHIAGAKVTRYTAQPKQEHGELATVELAYEIGAKGAEPTESERLLFEAWMRGHCWAVEGDWTGETYKHECESGQAIHTGAKDTRRLWAAWRDRAALGQSPKQDKDETVGALQQRAIDLHELGYMPWSEAHELALSEHGVSQSDIEELQCECSQSEIITGDDIPNFVRSVLVHGHHLVKAAPAKRQPLTSEQLLVRFCEDNGMEECDMCDLEDFTKVARYFEAAINGGGA